MVLGIRFLRSGLPGSHSENSAFFAYFSDQNAEFLYTVDYLAERGGFEPPVQLLTVQRFSKPPPSATRPPLRLLKT